MGCSLDRRSLGAALAAVAIFSVSEVARADDAMAPILAKDQFQVPSGLSPLRRAIVEAALGQVGTISSRPEKTKGLGGQRYGWERLLQYVKTSLLWDKVPDDWMRKIKGIQVPDPKMHPANNWCGYFATWALHEAGVQGLKWHFGPGLKKYFGKIRTDLAKMKPGDVALFSLRSHHSVVASVEGKDVITIDGNASYGEVNLHKRKLGSGQQRIVAFYSLDDLPASAVSNVRTAPAPERPATAEAETPAAQTPVAKPPMAVPGRAKPAPGHRPLLRSEWARVVRAGVRLRSRPRGLGRVLRTLRRCERVRVLELTKGSPFAKVRAGTRTVGYVQRQQLTFRTGACAARRR